MIHAQQVYFVNDEHPRLFDLLVKDVDDVITERHRQIEETASQQPGVGKDREARGRRFVRTQRQQWLDHRCHDVGARADGLREDHVRFGGVPQLIEARVQVVVVAAEAATRHLNGGHVRQREKGRVHQILALVVGHNPHALPLRHQILRRTDDGRGLTTPQKSADDV